MNKFLKIFLIIVLILAAGALVVYLSLPKTEPAEIVPQNLNAEQKADDPPLPDNQRPKPPEEEDLPTDRQEDFVKPLDNFAQRLTKKFFGDYITPAASPVQPEKFSGYHTGIDLESFPAEAEKDVIVKTICAGELKDKRFASGYGGVAVQECLLDGQIITVIYGHLKLDSINHQINNFLNRGEILGLLGKGYSEETDGERKHLHLGIHLGSQINIKGYVSSESELTDWLDPLAILN